MAIQENLLSPSQGSLPHLQGEDSKPLRENGLHSLIDIQKLLGDKRTFLKPPPLNSQKQCTQPERSKLGMMGGSTIMLSYNQIL